MSAKKHKLRELVAQCDPKIPPPADMVAWDGARSAVKPAKGRGAHSMTRSEFEFIARLLRSKEPAISAVRAVIFDKYTNADAARAAGITPQAVNRSTKRFLAMHKEICDTFRESLV